MNRPDVIINYYNPTYIKIQADKSILYELSEKFSFEIPNYKFIKKKDKERYKNWDGKIRLFNKKNNTIYFGLKDDVKKFCNENSYSCEINEDDKNYFYSNNFSELEAKKYIETLKLPYEIRPYQLKGFINAVRYKRLLFLSPTSSGKSLLIHIINSYYLNEIGCNKSLIITPNVTLVHQMSQDFISYGENELNIHRIYEGQEKQTDLPIVISTWQSINSIVKKHGYEWLNQFDIINVDEAHEAKAKVLTNILSNSKSNFRFGYTGTLDELECNELVLRGLFGPLNKLISTKEMIEKGFSSDLLIKTILLKYPDEQAKQYTNLIKNR